MPSSLLVSTTATTNCMPSLLPICVHFSQVINADARLITGRRKFNHISRPTHSIQVVLISRQVPAPSYLADMCIPVLATSGRTHLRSAVHCDLVVPRTRLARYGPRGFAVSGPVTWNSLPPDLRVTSLSAASFFSQLKTELFIRAYYTRS